MDPNNPYQGPQAALLETPRPGEATVGSARRRPVGHGWLWWKRAWSLVATNWVLWCLAVLVFFAVILGISLLSLFVPVLGSFVPTLFLPVLAAGLFHLAWRRWGDDDFEFGDLFAGFSNRTGALFLAGLMQLLLQIGFTALMAFRTAIPGAASRMGVLIGLGLLALWLANYVVGLVYPALEPSMLGKRDHCFSETLMFALAPAGLALLLGRRFYPLRPVYSTALFCLAAAMLPALYMQLACMYEPAHILQMHILPALLVTLAGTACAWGWARFKRR